jgi:hypothetical protein
MKLFSKITKEEREAMLKFPAYISLLGANSDGMLYTAKKKEASKLEFIKTFSADPPLTEFYREANKVFKNNLEMLDKNLPEGRESREAVMKYELMKLEKIILKLGR